MANDPLKIQGTIGRAGTNQTPYCACWRDFGSIGIPRQKRKASESW